MSEKPRDYWTPALGDLVWMNRQDFDEPEGKVVGFVPEHLPRAGQPVIERQHTEAGPFGGFRKGDLVVIHPTFLLPFPHGSEAWQQANREGRIG